MKRRRVAFADTSGSGPAAALRLPSPEGSGVPFTFIPSPRAILHLSASPYSNLSLLSCLASVGREGSPDWFVGVSGLSLRDDDGDWVEELEVVLYPLDAGTDSGPAYTSANDDTRPKEPIRGLQGERPFSDEPIGTFTFVLTDG
ncbi:hypothetical protein [Candidatus Palauibacter sp.]|uniref:hypothetical protein n=1 Tax=Candidatus Palauibacter sp. TaxID=3101350 RepID=UPI003CC5A315